MQRISIYQVKLQKVGTFPFENKTIQHCSGAAEIFRTYLEGYCHTDRESFLAMYLNTKNKVMGISTVHTGSLDASIVHPREVFTNAILHKAASIIVCHNHPSGNPTPSKEDILVTETLSQAGHTLGITLLDHIILGGNDRFYSLKDRGQIPQQIDREDWIGEPKEKMVKNRRSHELQR